MENIKIENVVNNVLRVKPIFGKVFADVYIDAKDLATRRNCTVGFIFNNVDVIVNELSTIYDVYNNYYNNLQLLHGI